MDTPPAREVLAKSRTLQGDGAAGIATIGAAGVEVVQELLTETQNAIRPLVPYLDECSHSNAHCCRPSESAIACAPERRSKGKDQAGRRPYRQNRKAARCKGKQDEQRRCGTIRIPGAETTKSILQAPGGQFDLAGPDH